MAAFNAINMQQIRQKKNIILTAFYVYVYLINTKITLRNYHAILSFKQAPTYVD